MNRIVTFGLTTFFALVGIGVWGMPQQAKGHGWQLYGGCSGQGWHPAHANQRCYGCSGCHGCCGGCYAGTHCYGCYGSYGCQGANGAGRYACSGGCYGCYGCYGAVPAQIVIVPSSAPAYSTSGGTPITNTVIREPRLMEMPEAAPRSDVIEVYEMP